MVRDIYIDSFAHCVCDCAQDFYEPINKAGLVGFLKNFLSNEDPDIRAKACSAIGNMCRHNSYFYSSLVRKQNLFLCRKKLHAIVLDKILNSPVVLVTGGKQGSSARG